MEQSAFASLLADLLERIPGSFGTALVDYDGETVDYAGWADTFELKVSAAHWRIVLAELERMPVFGTPRQLVIRAKNRTFLIHSLPDGYALLVLLSRRAGFAPSTRAVSVCERALHREAGWSAPAAARPWFVVDVGVDDRGRPTRLATISTFEVLGTLTGMRPREKGYRIRLASGAEFTLVREPGNHWYADEPVTDATFDDKNIDAGRASASFRRP